MLAAARAKAAEKGLSNLSFDALDLFDHELRQESFDGVCAFNIFYFLKDPEGCLLRIYSLLKPGGVCLSATDCLGDVKGLKTRAQLAMARMGVLPYMRGLTEAGLVGSFKAVGFTVCEVDSLHPEPPNLYIAARKG